MRSETILTGQIADVVRQVLPVQVDLRSFSDHADLYEAGLTSMLMVRLMLAVEVAFDISIPDADLHLDNFRSIAAIATLVARVRPR